MTLRHLKIFLTVCEKGSMTAAANHLHMTQPPVSQAIAELEEYYGVKLFERFGRKIYLTNEGEKLYSYASHILALADEAQKQLLDLSQNGILRVGASMTIGTAILPFIIKDFYQSYPKTYIQPVVDNTTTIIKMIETAKLDMAIVEGLVSSADIIKIPVYDDELVLICPSEHPYAKKKIIEPHELENQHFVIREEGSGTREIFEAAMHEYNIKWNIAGVFNSTEAIINAVHCGLGFSFISQLLADEAIKRQKVELVKVPKLKIKRKFNIVYHKNKFISNAMEKFLGYCQRYFGSIAYVGVGKNHLFNV
ncbi:transcriptional regulator, LysR family [Thermoanaerobacter kivui]|uniref:Transcriptional regulator, LysR family n=1 Tax=Thermoanaerobacter kivui TaxID=2325 RepID=A0A097ATG5_THEKI|nr:transcriptional regulator, LysR family [Thermoanaerobacter kivui]